MSAATRIVVADDDADIRELVTLKLAAAGYAVTSVCDGPAALEAIRRELPHLAVLDVLMPGMTGVEVCRALRAGGRRSGFRSFSSPRGCRNPTSRTATPQAPTTT